MDQYWGGNAPGWQPWLVYKSRLQARLPISHICLKVAAVTSYNPSRSDEIIRYTQILEHKRPVERDDHLPCCRVMAFSDATSLAIESWILYAIAILTVAARLSV